MVGSDFINIADKEHDTTQVFPLYSKCFFLKVDSEYLRTYTRVSKYRETLVNLCFLCQMGGKQVTEKYIEQKLVKAVKELGGIAPKFVSPGLDGVPDRIVLLPMGRIAFVELKAPGKKMRPLQVKRKRQLEALGFLVYCIDGVEQIGGVLDEIKNEM